MTEADKATIKNHVKYKSADLLLDCILEDFPNVRKDLFSMHDDYYNLPDNPFDDYLNKSSNNEDDFFGEYQSDVVFEDEEECKEIFKAVPEKISCST